MINIKKLGLLGYPLGHSFSKGYFTEKFKKENIKGYQYDNYALKDIEQLPEVIRTTPELIGLNVTIPYKEKVIPFLDEIEASANEIGAVNCIKLVRSGAQVKLIGYNTDAHGFAQPLKEVLKPHHTNALILGTGGASKAVAWVLSSLNLEYCFVSRNPQSDDDYSYEQLSDKTIENNLLIINTSPVGMAPNIHSKPALPYSAITEKHILYDIVYNPLKTEFLKQGEEKKATLINGLPMLYLQAEKSWEIWNS